MERSDNNVMTEEVQQAQQKEFKLVDVVIKDENTALNLMVSFLSLAQKRGAFTFDESAKIWECIRVFQKS
jgi:hypothetical protein